MEKTLMTAIQQVSETKSYIALCAEIALDDESKIVDFVRLISDQYFENEGNKNQLVNNYGKDTIETIVEYGKTIGVNPEKTSYGRMYSDCPSFLISIELSDHNKTRCRKKSGGKTKK